MVVDPEGRQWKVRRRWFHQTVPWRGPKGDSALDLFDGASLAGDAADMPVVGGIMIGIFALLVAVLAVVLVIPGLIFILELMAVLLIVGLSVVGRILFRRPWTVEARLAGTNEVHEWAVVGWRASGELVKSVAERLQTTGRL